MQAAYNVKRGKEAKRLSLQVNLHEIIEIVSSF